VLGRRAHQRRVGNRQKTKQGTQRKHNHGQKVN
jgi:hypothetical protein